MRTMVLNIDKHDRDLGRQIRRAMSSTALNLGEAEGSDPGNRRARLHTALGSARETRVGLQLACAWGYITSEELVPIDHALDRVCALTHGFGVDDALAYLDAAPLRVVAPQPKTRAA